MSTRAAQRREDTAAKARMHADELAGLEQQLLDEGDAIADRWQETAAQIDGESLTAKAADARVTDRAVVWVPVAGGG